MSRFLCFGMPVRFAAHEGSYRVWISVPYSSDSRFRTEEFLGTVYKVRGKWNGFTPRGNSCVANKSRRIDAVEELYAQRFGNPRIKNG